MSMKQKLLSHLDEYQHVQVAGYRQAAEVQMYSFLCIDTHPVPITSFRKRGMCVSVYVCVCVHFAFCLLAPLLKRQQ